MRFYSMELSELRFFLGGGKSAKILRIRHRNVNQKASSGRRLSESMAVKQSRLPVAANWRFKIHVFKGFRRSDSATRRSQNQFAPQQKRFDFVFKRIGDRVHGRRDRIDPGRTAKANANQCI